MSGFFTFSSPWLAVFWLLLGGLFLFLQFGMKRRGWQLGWFGVSALVTAALVFAPHFMGDMTWWVLQLLVFIILAGAGLLLAGFNYLLDGAIFDPRGAKGVVRRPFGPFERTLALRYLGTKREYGGLAFISVVSVIGIMLGVWALILTMSIMNGFRLELIKKIVGFEPHVIVDTRGMPMPQVEAMMVTLHDRPGVEQVGPMNEGMALASAYGRSEPVSVRGVRPEDLRANKLITDSLKPLDVAAMSSKPHNRCSPMFARPTGSGSLDHFGDAGDAATDLVMGDAFAYALGVGVGDKVTLTQPNGAHTAVGTSPRTRTFTVTAIFHVGNERYDRLTVFLPIQSSMNFFSDDGGFPIVSLRLADPDSADAFVRKLETEKQPDGRGLILQSWIERNGTYVTALVVERNVMRLILFIVVVITALNIITGVLMLVKNKARDIAILRTIGATRAGVVRVFLMSGTVLGMAGVGTGVLLGVLCALNIADIQHFLENLLGFCLFPPDIYQLDALPAQLEWGEVGSVAGLAFLVTIVMSIIPSIWAARLNPVEALRFE